MLDKVNPDSVIFDAVFCFWCLCARLLEVEDERGTREVESVALLECAKEAAGLFSGLFAYCAVADCPVQIELKQGGEFQRFYETIGSVNRKAPGVKVVAEHCLTLRDLLGDLAFELLECPGNSGQSVAFHFDEAAGDEPCLKVEVEEGKVGASETDFVFETVGVLFYGVVQRDMGVERYNQLVLKDALMFEVHAGERESEGFGALGWCRDELECETARERP